jgi:hypothetical protein
MFDFDCPRASARRELTSALIGVDQIAFALMEIRAFMVNKIGYDYFTHANVLPRFRDAEPYHLNPFRLFYLNHPTRENCLRVL